MQFNEYIKLVKNNLDVMSKDEMYQKIYNYARTLNKSKRSIFLKSLNSSNIEKIAFDKDKFDYFINQINNQKVYLKTDVQGEFNDKYHDWDNIIVYEKSPMLLGKLDSYIAAAIEMVSMKQYTQAFYILDQIAHLEVLTLNNYYGNQEIDIIELFDNKLLQLDKYNYYRNYLYCAL